jgi:hypothetical protein
VVEEKLSAPEELDAGDLIITNFSVYINGVREKRI